MSEDLTPKFEAIKKEVQDIIDKWNAAPAAEGSGLVAKLSQVFSFLVSVTTDLVELVEASKVVVKTDKKETVVAAAKYAYMQVNPDIPWIPEPFETKLEEWIFDALVPWLVDFLVSKFNEKGIFMKDDEPTDAVG
jgi:hypothetical protein